MEKWIGNQKPARNGSSLVAPLTTTMTDRSLISRHLTFRGWPLVLRKNSSPSATVRSLMMASFLSLRTEMPFNTMKSGTIDRTVSESVVWTRSLGRRIDLGKKGCLPKSTSSTNTDLGPAAGATAAAGLLSARAPDDRSRQAISSGASGVNGRCMVGKRGFKERWG